MSKAPQEWLKQADYDLDTAEYMHNGGRYFYAIFMCHMAIEKGLKGLYQATLNEVPPKVHNLVFLLNKIGVRPPEELGKFLVKLNEANVATRYPDEIEKLQREYTASVTLEILQKSKEAFKWIKAQF